MNRQVTMKQIAEIAGVSRGTVDRVIHNRGNVNPETERKVRDVLTQLNYRPSIPGKILAGKKRGLKIGVILISIGNPFFDDIIKGFKIASEIYLDYGVNIDLYRLEGYDVQKQIDKIDKIKEDIDVLIFNPIDDIRISKKIDELLKEDITVININTDIKNRGENIFYVGSDYTQGGKMACGMLSLIKSQRARIGIMTGSKNILGHNQRIEGIEKSLKKYPNMEILEVYETKDSDEIGYKNAKKLLRTKDIDSIIIIAAGVEGVCKAVVESKKDITVISFDDIPATRKLIKAGVISATICQSPVNQALNAVKIAYDYEITGRKPEYEDRIVKNEIKILENL